MKGETIMKKIAKTLICMSCVVALMFTMLAIGCSAAVVPYGEGFATVGDANADNVVNIKDFVRVKLYVAERTSDVLVVAADYDMSGDIEIDDVVSMRKALLGISESADWSTGIY